MRHLFLTLIGLTILLAGCDRSVAVLNQHAENAAAAPGLITRQQIATQMIQDWHADKLTLDAAIDLAFERIDGGEDATTFAGAVLDLAVGIEGELPRQPEMAEFLLRRIGRLAFLAAQTAGEAGRIQEAAELSLAGPDRWKTERYWIQYPDHDGLVSVLMAMTGQRSEALARLRSRPIMQDPLEQALEAIRQIP